MNTRTNKPRRKAYPYAEVSRWRRFGFGFCCGYAPAGPLMLRVCFLVLMLVSGMSAVALNPLDMYLVRQHAPSYIPGEMLEITVTIDTAMEGYIYALGLRETLPEGWRYQSASGYDDLPPAILPGRGEGPGLDFAWITPPYLPYTFMYTVMPPERDGGDQEIVGLVEYRLEEGPYFSAPLVTVVSGPEQIAPLIMLRGANPMTVYRGLPWHEPGYTALDHNDQDITGKVMVSGTVDTNRPGVYRLVYRVAATEEGVSAQVERTVHVVDAVSEASPESPSAAPVASPPTSSAGEDRSGGARPVPTTLDVLPQPGSGSDGGHGVSSPGGVRGTPMFPDLSAYRPLTPERAEAPVEGAASAATAIADLRTSPKADKDDRPRNARSPVFPEDFLQQTPIPMESQNGDASAGYEEMPVSKETTVPIAASAGVVHEEPKRLYWRTARYRLWAGLFVLLVGMVLIGMGWRWMHAASRGKKRRAVKS